MTDLVQRLRQHWKYEGSLLHEAADEIERLHKIIEQRSIANREVVIDDMRKWAKKTEKEVGNTARSWVINAYCKDRGVE